MPSLQYVQTNNDPSVGEALHGVAQTLNNAKEIAIRHQLLQLQAQKEMADLQSAGLNQQIQQQALMEHKAMWDSGIPMDQAQAELERTQAQVPQMEAQTGLTQAETGVAQQHAQGLQTQNQYAGPLAQLSLQSGQQSLQQQQIQMGFMPGELSLKQGIGQENLKQEKSKTDLIGTQQLSAMRDYLQEMDGRKGWSEVAAQMAEATMPNGPELGKQIRLNGPIWSEKLREGFLKLYQDSAQQTLESERTHAMIEAARAHKQQIEQSTTGMFQTALENANPNDPKQVDALTQTLYNLQHGGPLPKVEVPGTAATFMQPTQAVDRSSIEALKPTVLKLIQNARAKKAGTAQPAQSQVDQQDETPTSSASTGSSKDSPVTLKPGEDWRKHKAGEWVQFAGQPAMQVPPH